MKIKILGREWELKYCDNLSTRGLCDSPTTINKKIRIWKGLKDREELEVLLHEMLHAAFWQIDEEFIDEASKDISIVLDKLGYKK